MPIMVVVDTRGIEELAKDVSVASSSIDFSQALYDAVITYALPTAEQNATNEFNVRTGFYSSSFDATIIDRNIVEVTNPAPYANRLENEVFRYAGGPHMVLYTAILEVLDSMTQYIKDWLDVNEISTWGQA